MGPRTVSIPDFALVVLVSGSPEARATFARRHFRATEIVSADRARLLVMDDAGTDESPGAARALCHVLVEKRLENRRLTLVDGGGLDRSGRRDYVETARRHHTLPVAVALDAACNIEGLRSEGFRQVHHLGTPEEVDRALVRREPLRVDRRRDRGPFDIIGDVHGCGDEMETLLARLGYHVAFSGRGIARTCRVTPPAGRKAVFLGDLVDRGPRVMDVLRLVMTMVEDGTALCVVGNHDDKFRRWLDGRNVKVSHGLAETIAQVEVEPAAFRDRVRSFLDTLAPHYWLDQGRLCVAHAGLTEAMIGRVSGAVRAFALYGQTSGETDEFGLPVRHDWAAHYAGRTRVVYGHTPVMTPEWVNGTLCVDTGCVFGGALTALRYPECELVSVTAARTYFQPQRPLGGQQS